MSDFSSGETLRFVDRRNTNSNKWDGLKDMYGTADLQAMWVADMDFQAPQCVRDALSAYLAQGVFGYYKVPQSYFEAFMQWEKDVHGYSVQREWVRVTPGVVPAINWFLQSMTQPGDEILVLTPVYYPFMDAVKNNERRLVCCDLVNENGRYTIDFAALEDTLRAHQLWCNVGADNEASLRLFRSAGFTEIGVKRDWLWRPDGYHDEVMLQKML